MAIAPAPRTDVDIFSDEVLRDPYPTYAELRAMGPAVHLDRLGVWALPRYAQVRSALGDWKTFSSSAAVGLNDVVNGSVAGTVLATDPPEHETLRAVLTEQLGPRALRDIRTFIERSAEDLVDRLVQRGRFDAVSDLAVALPMSVVFDLIGLPEHVRGDMLRWAEGTFQVFGPMNERTQRSLPIIEEMYSWLATVRAEDLAPGSMGRAIFAAAEAGRIEHDSCVPLLSAYTTAGMDTTISALAHAIHLLGRYPQQWDALRAAPEAIPGALNEVLRYDAPVQVFARKLTRELSIDGTRLPAGAPVALLFGSANRDERHYADPDRFDISRNPADHLSFGYGRHACSGQALAKIEGHALLHALATRVRRMHVGEPVRRLNNVVRGLESLPVAELEMAG